MIEVPNYIRNHEAVVSAFGYWPSFHDATVLSFEHKSDSITLAVHVWEMTSQLNPQGYFVLHKHHIVRFSFRGIVQTDLTHFISANILFELLFSPCSEFDDAGRFTVGLESAMGGDLCGSFTATFGEVTSVLPCDRNAQTT